MGCRKLLFIVILIIIVPTVIAKEGSMKLLAVKEGPLGAGSKADLHLELRPGSGRVFLDT